jgi:hypothetical protein
MGVDSFKPAPSKAEGAAPRTQSRRYRLLGDGSGCAGRQIDRQAGWSGASLATEVRRASLAKREQKRFQSRSPRGRR